jgi:hypothetical protein
LTYHSHHVSEYSFQPYENANFLYCTDDIEKVAWFYFWNKNTKQFVGGGNNNVLGIAIFNQNNI